LLESAVKLTHVIKKASTQLHVVATW